MLRDALIPWAELSLSQQFTIVDAHRGDAGLYIAPTRSGIKKPPKPKVAKPKTTKPRSKATSAKKVARLVKMLAGLSPEEIQRALKEGA